MMKNYKDNCMPIRLLGVFTTREGERERETERGRIVSMKTRYQVFYGLLNSVLLFEIFPYCNGVECRHNSARVKIL